MLVIAPAFKIKYQVLKVARVKYLSRHRAHNPPSAGQGYFSRIQFVSSHCVRCD